MKLLVKKLVALGLGLFAAPAALALTPEEVAMHASQLGRPLPSYIRITPTVQETQQSQERPRQILATADAFTIYLNRFPTTYTCGNDDSLNNVSSIACNAGNSATVGGFGLSDNAWSQVRSCVQDLFSPFNLNVTDVEPTSGSYVESVIGGSPGDVGMPFGVGGVAPYDCSVIDRAVVYTFADVYGNDIRGICETAAQEIAHAFGLDHQLLCEDPMTYLGGCGNKSFQDTYSVCGEFESRECSCPQPGTGDFSAQNSVQWMLQLFGASDGSPPPPPPDDREPPTATILSPDADAVLQANSTIVVEAAVSDDVGLTIVELEWDFSGEAMFCPGDGGAWACSRSNGVATWQISVGEGARTFRVHVRDVVGNEATSQDRSIWLSPDGQPPPNDEGAPTVFIATPSDGAVLPANELMQVVATIADDSGISRAELVWPFNDGVFPCPFETQGISCAVAGNTYTWSLQVGEGDRTFSVRAVDLVGNVTETARRSIELVPGADRPAEDGNDTIDQATPIGCGDSVEVQSNDADWFVVDAPDGQNVKVVVSGQAASELDLVATKGPRNEDVISEGREEVEFTADGETKLAVVPVSAGAGAYTLEIICEESVNPEKPGGLFVCGAAALPSSMALWAGLLALLRVRRRR